MMKWLPPAALLALSGCSGDVTANPDKWSCEALVGPVIAMSKERSPTILEITEPEETNRMYGPNASISCRGKAEWDQGYGMAEYGAHVSPGGNVILEYRQN